MKPVNDTAPQADQDTTSGLPRRQLLQGMAGILAAGTFPAVHAQEKIVLRYLVT